MLNNKVVEETETSRENLICVVLFVVAVVVAIWMRFTQISVKPFHHDEGVNSYFLLNLANKAHTNTIPRIITARHCIISL